MKHAVQLFIIALSMIVAISCTLPSEELPKQKAIVFKTTTRTLPSYKDSIIFDESAIQSFNGSTGEIIFVDSANVSSLLAHHKISCFMGTDSLFSFTVTSDLMSAVYDDLVLNHNLFDHKYYFADGYPVLYNYPTSVEKRTENAAQRATGWKKFTEQLKADGKFLTK